MLPYAEPSTTPPNRRPVISELTNNSDGGKSFIITFAEGQELPTHRNVSRILIQVHRGTGTIVIDSDPAEPLASGDLVQIAPNAPHSLVAGDDGLEVEVHLVADCCSSC